MGDFVVDGFQGGLCFVGSRLKDYVDWSNVTLCVVADADKVYQFAVDQVALEARVRLLHDE